MNSYIIIEWEHFSILQQFYSTSHFYKVFIKQTRRQVCNRGSESSFKVQLTLYNTYSFIQFPKPNEVIVSTSMNHKILLILSPQEKQFFIWLCLKGSQLTNFSQKYYTRFIPALNTKKKIWERGFGLKNLECK